VDEKALNGAGGVPGRPLGQRDAWEHRTTYHPLHYLSGHSWRQFAMNTTLHPVDNQMLHP
jgi:hypothetical protein